jgi:dihydrofolate reductase
MRTLIAQAFISLDGVMQGPGGPDEDPTGGFTHGGWAVPYWDEDMLRRMENPDPPYELLLGRGTYEIFAAHWPFAEGGIAEHLNRTRKYVASTTLERVDWNNSTLLDGDVAAAVAALKREDGPEIQVHGSVGLLQTLLRHGLIDRLDVWTFPVVLGTGKRLFGDGAVPAALRLLAGEVTATGVTVNRYEPAGAIDPGSFEFDQPTEAELERRRRLTRSP